MKLNLDLEECEKVRNLKAKTCGIYLIQNTVDGQVYVGQSVDVKRRMYGHLTALRSGLISKVNP